MFFLKFAMGEIMARIKADFFELISHLREISLDFYLYTDTMNIS